MLKVFYHDEVEVNDNFWAPPECASYVVTKKGRQINLDHLPDEHVNSFVWQAVHQSAEEKKQNPKAEAKVYDADHYEKIREAQRLLYCVKLEQPRYYPSAETLHYFLKMLYNQDQDIRGFAKEAMKDFIKENNFQEICEKAKQIKSADKEQVGYHEMCEAVDIFWREHKKDFTYISEKTNKIIEEQSI